MLQMLLQLINTIFGFFNSLLPTSPFGDYIQGSEQIILGISWLNWVLPIGEMLALMVIWLGVCLAVCAVKVALDITGSVGSKVAGN